MLGLVQMLFFVQMAVTASSLFIWLQRKRGEQLRSNPGDLLTAHLVPAWPYPRLGWMSGSEPQAGEGCVCVCAN